MRSHPFDEFERRRPSLFTVVRLLRQRKLVTLCPHGRIARVFLENRGYCNIRRGGRLIGISHWGDDPWTIRPCSDLTATLKIEVWKVVGISHILEILHRLKCRNALRSIEGRFRSILGEELASVLRLKG